MSTVFWSCCGAKPFCAFKLSLALATEAVFSFHCYDVLCCSDFAICFLFLKCYIVYINSITIPFIYLYILCYLMSWKCCKYITRLVKVFVVCKFYSLLLVLHLSCVFCLYFSINPICHVYVISRRGKYS